jgi:hypothetical protein
MDEEEEVKTMSRSDDTFNMSAKELRKLKKKERKVARRAMLKVTPNVNISRSSQVTILPSNICFIPSIYALSQKVSCNKAKLTLLSFNIETKF